LLVVFPVFSAWGADQNIYIDNQTGVGSEDGSISDPYHDFSDINWTTGGANSIYDWVAGGDSVYINLAQDDIFRDMLTLGTDGASGRSVYFRGYNDGGAGANPIIYTTKEYDSTDFGAAWYDSGGKKIYRTTVTHDFVWGVAVDGQRVGYYNTTNTTDIQNNLQDGHVAHSKSSGNFWLYYRKDVGAVGSVEVGERLHAIHGNGKSYITLDGIDTFGGVGSPDSISNTNYLSQVFFEVTSTDTMDGITIKNSEHSHGADGIIFQVWMTTASGTNLLVDNVWAHHFRYYSIAGYGAATVDDYDSQTMDGITVQNSVFENCSGVPNDTGDLECGAIRRAKNVLFTGNYVSTNGYDFSTRYGASVDTACSSLMTFIENYNTVSSYNYFHNACGTGTHHAEAGGTRIASYNVDFMYNVIDTWGRENSSHSFNDTALFIGSRVNFLTDEVTRVSSGTVRILNNLFINGPASKDDYTGSDDFSCISTLNEFEALDISNNIAENIPHDDMYFLHLWYSHDNSPTITVRNNDIHKTSGTAFRHKTGPTTWAWNKVGDAGSGDYGYDDHDGVSASVNFNDDPLLNSTVAGHSNSKHLLPGSPAIDTGLDLGASYDDGIDPANYTYTRPISITKLDQDLYGAGWDLGPFIFSLFISNPIPVQNDTGTSETVDLSWTNPTGATSVNVYFDKTTNPPTTQIHTGTLVATHDVGTLDNSSDYYWRVDVVHAGGTQAGTVYHFTTAAGPPAAEGNIDRHGH